MKKISIVTGTLNRINILPTILENTIYNNENIELVIIDGGSTDGTVEYLESIEHNRLKKIFVGERSFYWHYMNIGIKESSHEWICQWNDDVLMLNDWNEVLNKLNEDEHQMYVFSWKEDMIHHDFFILEDNDKTIMNFGIYHKDVFRKIGMYDSSFTYYYCDADMSLRTQYAGFKCLKMNDIKCKSLFLGYKNAYTTDSNFEIQNYKSKEQNYKNGIFEGAKLLKDKKVISFSIYGDQKKYTQGLIRNIELAQTYYPDWICYVYYDSTVPNKLINKVKLYMNTKTINMTGSKIPGMFWRFLPADNVERFIVRDTDSRLGEREKLAVDQWIEDGTTLHIMRDHPHHFYHILGGMWGMKSVENLESSILKYLEGKEFDKEVKMTDMDYLRDFIYPKYHQDSTIHSSQSEFRIEPNCRSFPSKMVNYNFVGEIFDELDKRSYHWQELLGREEY